MVILRFERQMHGSWETSASRNQYSIYIIYLYIKVETVGEYKILSYTLFLS